MPTAVIVGLAVFFEVILVVWGIMVFNRLIRMRTLKEEGWSGIDVQLKRRHDLIGNLVNTVKGYMQHERELLEEIARLRSASQEARGVSAVAEAESGLNASLGRLLARVENYPELRANENVMYLQRALSELEHELQMARRYYNATVRDFNIIAQSFPSSLVARAFSFAAGEFFELDNVKEAASPQVAF